MGMGFQGISQFSASPVFQSLVAAGQVSQSVFSFALGGSSGPELFLGGINWSKLSGAITYTPVTQQGYWQVQMDGANVNGNRVTGSVAAIIDTGTTLIIGDVNNVRQFYAAIPGSADATDTIGAGYWTGE